MEIEIKSTVLKMYIGKTEKDKEEGLITKLSFDVKGSPTSLARMANLLKQGEVNIVLAIKATNAATDVEVNTINLPHQMSLGEEALAKSNEKSNTQSNVSSNVSPASKPEEKPATDVKATPETVKDPGAELFPETPADTGSAATTEQTTGAAGATTENKEAAAAEKTKNKTARGGKKKGNAETPGTGTISPAAAGTEGTVTCKNCSYSAPAIQFAGQDKKFCPACGNPIDGEQSKIEDTVPLYDLSTFEIRPQLSKSVPAKVFFNKTSEEVVDGDIKKTLLNIFNRTVGFKFESVDDLIATIEKQPKTDQRDQILEILTSKVVSVV